MTDTDLETTQIEAAAFRRLLQHLMRERPDVQNIDLMILAGFCRNCLSDWYREAAEARGHHHDQGRGARGGLRHAVRGMEGEAPARRHAGAAGRVRGGPAQA